MPQNDENVRSEIHFKRLECDGRSGRQPLMPMHWDIATVDYSDHGAITISISLVPPGGIFVSFNDEWYSIDLSDIIDAVLMVKEERGTEDQRLLCKFPAEQVLDALACIYRGDQRCAQSPSADRRVRSHMDPHEIDECLSALWACKPLVDELVAKAWCGLVGPPMASNLKSVNNDLMDNVRRACVLIDEGKAASKSVSTDPEGWVLDKMLNKDIQACLDVLLDLGRACGHQGGA